MRLDEDRGGIDMNYELTAFETEIVRQLMFSKRNPEIAVGMGVTEYKVRSTLDKLHFRFGSHSNAELVAKLLAYGAIENVYSMPT